MKDGTLYVVATPIGNLDDITFRAVDVLGRVDLIACEDTRRSQALLKRYRIRTRFMSLHKFSERRKIDTVLERLRQGQHVALISDAGTPAISDPGSRLVNAAIHAGFTVTPIPGPSAITAALSVSGIEAPRFCYLGFVPRKEHQRARFFSQIKDQSDPVVFFESPKRVRDTLATSAQVLGDRPLILVRELTKIHEEILHGTAETVLEELGNRETVKGEIIIIVDGGNPVLSAQDVSEVVKELMAEGLSGKHLAEEAHARFGVKKKTAYDAFLQELEDRTRGDDSDEGL